MTTRALTVAAVVCALAIGGLFAGIADSSNPARTPRADIEPVEPAHEAQTAVAPQAPRTVRSARAVALPPLAPRDPVDPIEIERDLAEADAVLARTFDAAPARPAWEREARATLSAALESFAVEAPFRTTSVECRGSMCRAQVEATETNGDVMSWGSQLIGANYGLGCSTHIRFSPPTTDDTPQTGTLYLTDCAR